MADWQAFATAFLGDTATYINERKDKAEDYADKLAEQAERNKGKLSQLRQAADAQNSFVGQARDLHASDAQIEAALDAGPEGLKTLVGTLNTLRSAYGSSFNADLVKEAAALPEAFSPTGNIDVYSRYGLGSQTMGDIEAPKGGWFARAMGTDAKARVRAEADAEAFGGTGMSVYDMAELDSVTGYTSRNSGSYLRYTQPKIFNPANTAEEQTNIMTRAKLVMDMDGYTAFDTAIANADTKFKTPQQVAAEVANLKAQQKQFLTDNLYGYIDTQTALFGESYLEAVGPSLQSLGLSPDNLSPVKGTVGTVDAGSLSSGVTENEDGSLAVTFSTTNEDGEATIDSFTVTVDGLVKGSNGTVLSPEQSAAVLDKYGLVSPAALAAAAEDDVAEVGAEVGAEVIEDPIMAAYQEYGQSRKAGVPLTAEDVRNQAGAVSESVVDAANATLSFTQGATQTAGYWADRGLAYAATPFSKATSAADMALGSIFDAFGYTEAADTAYGMVADRVNNRVKQRENGFFATMFETEGGNDESVMLDAMSKMFGFNKEELEGNPELVKAVTDLNADARQRIDDLDKQFLADDKNFPQPAPRRYAPSTEQRLEAASDTNLDRMEQSRLGRVGAESDRLSTESKSMPDGYIPVQIGATELNLPSVIEGLSVAARNALEKDLKAWSERPTPRGYQPTQIGATELNLPKMLEALKPKTRTMVEKELQALPQTPERRANAARDQRVSNEVNRRELTEGATRIAEMLSRPTSEVSQEELTKFIMEVQAKFGEDAVKAELQRVIRGRAAKGGTE